MSTSISLHPRWEGMTAKTDRAGDSPYLKLQIGTVEITIFGAPEAAEALDKVAALLSKTFPAPPPEPKPEPFEWADGDIPF